MKPRYIISVLLAFGTLAGGCATKPVSSWKGKTDVGAIYCTAPVPTSGLQGLLDSPPTFKKKVLPAYPAEALGRGETGVVAVHFVLTPTGEISDVQASALAKKTFIAAAEECVSKWEMNPRVVNGKKVRSIVTVCLGFGCEAPRLDTTYSGNGSDWPFKTSPRSEDPYKDNYQQPSAMN